MNWFEILVLGIIQGLTELLPVSSSAHLVMMPKLLGWQDPGLNIDAFLHLGTLAAIIWYFRKDLYAMLTDKAYRKLALGIGIATVPVVLIGFSVKDYIEHSETLRSLDFMAFTLALVAVVLYFADKLSHKQKALLDLNYLTMLLIGLAQCLALFPGVSRSGACIIAALLLGLKREAAARFAFLIGIPAIGGAGLLACVDITKEYIAAPQAFNFYNEALYLFIGFTSSFIVGFLALKFMLAYISKYSYTPFVIYRIILAALLYFVF